jgi:hypothetical protein|nr:MAG TPA: hypothetical protein [Caudoviricetes sp.]
MEDYSNYRRELNSLKFQAYFQNPELFLRAFPEEDKETNPEDVSLEITKDELQDLDELLSSFGEVEFRDSQLEEWT